jgi:hypothetical protein
MVRPGSAGSTNVYVLKTAWGLQSGIVAPRAPVVQPLRGKIPGL